MTDARPNIVVILADDLGYGDVGYNGASGIETPNIDRLAREGIVFSNGYVTSPICGPSRAGLLTGRYQARFGMDETLAHMPMDSQHGLPVAETTFARHLQQAGYSTALIGKWHLGAAAPFHPLNRGFDRFFGILGGVHHYFEVDTTLGGEALAPLSDDKGAAGFEGYLTDALTDQAVAFIEQRTSNRRDGTLSALSAPFFLYLAYNAPHVPIQAPWPLYNKYAHVTDPIQRGYHAMVDSLDAGIGRVLAALEATQQRHNTLVFFLSDNGGVWPWRIGLEHYTWSDNGPLRGGKASLFEGGIRVPFVASWPARWPKDTTYAEPIISLDIAATALAVADVAADPQRPLDGVNLDPYLRGLRGELAGAPHDALFWRREAGRYPSYAVRVGDLKLVKARSNDELALFDLRSDLGETRNLVREQAAVAGRLADIWNDWNESNLRNQFPNGSAYHRQLGEWMREQAEAPRAAQVESFRIALPSSQAEHRDTPSSGRPAAAH